MRNVIGMRIARFDLVAGPENWLEEGRRNLTDSTGHGWNCLNFVALGLDPVADLEAAIQRGGSQLMVERKDATRGNNDAVQKGGCQFDIVASRRDRASIRGRIVSNQLQPGELASLISSNRWCHARHG